MSDNPWNEVERLLNEALDRPPHERDAFLREACGDDAALRGEVESLLVHASADSRLLLSLSTRRHSSSVSSTDCNCSSECDTGVLPANSACETWL